MGPSDLRFAFGTLLLMTSAAGAAGCRRSVAERTDAAIAAAPGAEVPDGFPKSVPIYPGSITRGGKRSDLGKVTYNVSVETADDLDRVISFYGATLALGPKETASPDTDPTLLVVNGDSRGTVLVFDDKRGNYGTIALKRDAKTDKTTVDMIVRTATR